MVGRDEVGLPRLPVPPAATSTGTTTLAGSACWLRLRGLSSMNGLVPQSLPTEQRKVAGSIPAPPILINAVNSPVYDLDWPVPVETDNRSRCVRSLVRCGAHLGLGCPCQAFWWSGHAPVTNVAGNCVPSVRTGRVGIHPQSNAGVVEKVQLVLPGVRLVVRVRSVGGGDPPSSEYQPSGLAIAKGGTLRHQVATAFATQ